MNLHEDFTGPQPQPALQFPKPQRYESARYLKFVRDHKCVVLKCWRKSEAHHVVFDGMGRVGSKVDDTFALPLCEQHHRQYHQMGRERFEATFGLNLALEIIGLLTEWAGYLEAAATALGKEAR